MSAPKTLTLLGEGKKGARIHDLVKAPANTPWARARQQSWDASEPATVYFTPETLADGTPCSAVTVILRTKGCHWWWSSGCTFCGYFNDTRDDVTSQDLHAQWENALSKFPIIQSRKNKRQLQPHILAHYHHRILQEPSKGEFQHLQVVVSACKFSEI